MPEPVCSLRDVKQPDVGPDWFARLAHLDEHVPVDLGELIARDAGAKVEAVAVLGDNVGDLTGPVEHEEGHVGGGRLG